MPAYHTIRSADARINKVRGGSRYTANVFRTPAAYTFHGTIFRSRGNHVA